MTDKTTVHSGQAEHAAHQQRLANPPKPAVTPKVVGPLTTTDEMLYGKVKVGSVTPLEDGALEVTFGYAGWMKDILKQKFPGHEAALPMPRTSDARTNYMTDFRLVRLEGTEKQRFLDEYALYQKIGKRSEGPAVFLP